MANKSYKSIRFTPFVPDSKRLSYCLRKLSILASSAARLSCKLDIMSSSSNAVAVSPAKLKSSSESNSDISSLIASNLSLKPLGSSTSAIPRASISSLKLSRRVSMSVPKSPILVSSAAFSSLRPWIIPRSSSSSARVAVLSAEKSSLLSNPPSSFSAFDSWAKYLSKSVDSGS